MRHPFKLAALTLALLAAARADAQQTRVYEEGGTTYRETRHVVQRPVVETRVEPRQRTVYRERVTTESLPTHRTSWAPITEYRWEAYWRGRFNPFTQPWLEHRLVPRTHWEPRTDVVHVPVSRRELVPETVTDHVPVTTQRFVDEEIISRIPVDGQPTRSASTSPAPRNQIGGIANLSSDRPVRSVDSDWRPAVAPGVRY